MSNGYTTVGPTIRTFVGGQNINIPIDPSYPHNFVGVIPVDEDGNFESGCSGMATVYIRTVTSPGVLQSPPDNLIDLSAPHDVSFAANAVSILIEVDNLLDAPAVSVMVAQNKA